MLKGYTKKIQKLGKYFNQAYTIEPYDTYSKVFEDVEGFQGTDVGLQLKPMAISGGSYSMIPLGF